MDLLTLTLYKIVLFPFVCVVHEKLSAVPNAEVAELRGVLQALRDEQLRDQAVKIIRKLP